ncbi:uncharacterized protein LOC113579536 [Electrophorus electricus]|uniref:uncharacterized protein LOC113579536 n=1 Tax=Electrophorus electricus TaxID=8005 RepID=UPI0015D059D7|nr:uncharacterized protein LOC113579536 [Electrophorus electricus]
MSLGVSLKPNRPARPPSLDPSVAPPTPLRPAGDSPIYLSVLSEELPDQWNATPARPAPPVPRRPVPYREDQPAQITQPKNLNEYKESTGIRNTEDPLPSITSDAKWVLYKDVLSDETDCPPQDCTTPQNHPPPRPLAPPRPAAPPHPAVIRPRRPSLSESTSEGPTEHLYEYLPDILPDAQLQDEAGWASSSPVLPAVPTEGRPQRSCSRNEQSSVEGNSCKELQLLLDWWRSLEEWEQLAMHYQGHETKLLITVVHRVKMAMHLFELLMFEHGRVLLNYIMELHCTANSVDKVNKKKRIMGMTGGTTGAVGAVAVVAGLALAPLTFGASVVAAGIGVGVAAAGGVAGASAAITGKVKSSQFRQKVEGILRNYKSEMEDIVGCLKFIDVGMEHLRMQDHLELKYMDADAVKIVQMAQETEGFASIDAVAKCVYVLQAFASGIDSYYAEEDKLRLKKDSESQFAGEVREVAVRLKEGMDELIRVKNLFRSVVL